MVPREVDNCIDHGVGCYEVAPQLSAEGEYPLAGPRIGNN